MHAVSTDIRRGFYAVLTALLLLLQAGSPAFSQEEVALETPISAESGPEVDRRIRERLMSIYASLDGLETVEVQVEQGVVKLSGEVFERKAEERALEIAARTADVVSVQNELVYDQDVTRKLDIAWNKLAERGAGILQFLPVLLVACLIFGVFWALGGWLTRGRSLFDRIAPNLFIGDLLRLLVRIAITLIGLVVALEVADATAILGSVLGALGLVGLAVGFAIRDTVENFIASILLSLRQPFAPNDHVIIQGNEGLVLRLTSRATLLMTFDGNHIRIPNAVVYKGVITNFSRNPRRRFSFEIGVGTDVNLIEAVQLGRDTLASSPGVLADPAPVVQIHSLGDSSVLLKFFAWINQSESNYTSVKSETLRRVKVAYEQAGFDMPEPIYRVNLRGGDLTTGANSGPGSAVAWSSDAGSPGAGSPDAGSPDAGSSPPSAAETVDAGMLEEDSPEQAALAQAQAEVEAGIAGEGTNLLDENAPRE